MHKTIKTIAGAAVLMGAVSLVPTFSMSAYATGFDGVDSSNAPVQAPSLFVGENGAISVDGAFESVENASDVTVTIKSGATATINTSLNISTTGDTITGTDGAPRHIQLVVESGATLKVANGATVSLVHTNFSNAGKIVVVDGTLNTDVTIANDAEVIKGTLNVLTVDSKVEVRENGTLSANTFGTNADVTIYASPVDADNDGVIDNTPATGTVTAANGVVLGTDNDNLKLSYSDEDGYFKPNTWTVANAAGTYTATATRTKYIVKVFDIANAVSATHYTATTVDNMVTTFGQLIEDQLEEARAQNEVAQGYTWFFEGWKIQDTDENGAPRVDENGNPVFVALDKSTVISANTRIYTNYVAPVDDAFITLQKADGTIMIDHESVNNPLMTLAEYLEAKGIETPDGFGWFIQKAAGARSAEDYEKIDDPATERIAEANTSKIYRLLEVENNGDENNNGGEEDGGNGTTGGDNGTTGGDNGTTGGNDEDKVVPLPGEKDKDGADAPKTPEGADTAGFVSSDESATAATPAIVAAVAAIVAGLGVVVAKLFKKSER